MTNADRYNEFFDPIVDTLLDKHQIRVYRKTKASSGRLFESGYGNRIQYEIRLAEGNKARVALFVDSSSREWNIQLVDHLVQRREKIESALGPLGWEQEKSTKRRRIEITKPGSIYDDDHTLTEIREWMVYNLLNFKRVFDPHLKDLLGQYRGPMETNAVIHNDKAIAGAPPVFEGTQVPVKELHSYMHKDWNLYGFLHKFPSVAMEQALAEMERHARETVQRITQRDKNIADGALVFQQSDVPVGRLFDYLSDVKGLKDFHWDFPSVFREDTYDAIITSGRILELDAYRGVTNGIVDSDRSYVSGAPKFVGTRLPIRILFDLLADACTLKDFSYNFSGASREQLMGILRLAHEVLEREACASAAR